MSTELSEKQKRVIDQIYKLVKDAHSKLQQSSKINLLTLCGHYGVPKEIADTIRSMGLVIKKGDGPDTVWSFKRNSRPSLNMAIEIYNNFYGENIPMEREGSEEEVVKTTAPERYLVALMDVRNHCNDESDILNPSKFIKERGITSGFISHMVKLKIIEKVRKWEYRWIALEKDPCMEMVNEIKASIKKYSDRKKKEKEAALVEELNKPSEPVEEMQGFHDVKHGPIDPPFLSTSKMKEVKEAAIVEYDINKSVVRLDENWNEVVKPPIGLRPLFVSKLERLNEVREAIVRYYDAQLRIPIEWVEEYNELIDITKK